jgi:hypothetical protein
MIRPESCRVAVGRVRYLACPVAHGRRQLTVVEVTADQRTSAEFDMYVHIPTGSEPADELGFVDGEMVNESLEHWNLKDDRPGTTQVAANFEVCDPGTAELSGCGLWARLRCPAGPCCITAAWTHAMQDSGHLFVPTQNVSLSCWCSDIVVLGTANDKYGITPSVPIAANSPWLARLPEKLGPTPPAGNAFVVRMWSAALPFHNLYFPMEKASPKERSYTGLSGARLRDDTRQHLVSMCEVGFQTVPVVCGCYVRDGLNYEKAHVPLSIMERVTRRGPLVFFDGPEGTDSVMFRVVSSSGADRVISVNVLDREEFGGVNWVTAKFL